ncbi:MAG TPA: DUF4091 domain-containing protein [Bryobacteraceae bacterium]|nr:DUF4091 domain-containing protein [Bryobacteraceae bacterium]
MPRESQPGAYAGTYNVTSDQGAVRGHISLQVWNFTLPVKPSLHSAFMIWQPDELPIARTLLQNKISPFSKSPEVARKLKGEGLSILGLPFWSGADVSHCAMQPAPSLAVVRAAIARVPPGLDLVDYTADEVGNCPNLYAGLREWGSVLHKAGVQNLVTIPPTPELLDDGLGKGRSAVDIWAVLAEGYVAKLGAIKKAMAKGDSVWSYTTLVQDPYSPKWEIDFSPINFRIQPGFLSQTLGLTGILYWRVDLWTADPWATADTTGRFNSNNYPGEGMLVYPGAPAGVHGVVPSMRLKWIRDGVEDYEYVALLKQLGYGAWGQQIAAQAGTDWSHWTQDPAVLESAREQLGRKLDSLAAAQQSSRP